MSSTKWEYGNTYSEFNPNLKIYVKKTALIHYKDEITSTLVGSVTLHK